jgi:Domain of Unknown Function (DUF1206)
VTSGPAEVGRRAASAAANNPALAVGVRVGLVSLGVVHLLIAWIAMQTAWGHEAKSANSSGALRELAQQPLGKALLWVVVGGFLALVLWQAGEAVWGHSDQEGKKRLAKRLSSAARAVLYAVLALSAFGIVTGSGSGGSSPDSKTADLMKMTGGQLIVGLIGLAIVVTGVVFVVRGFKASFTHHLQAQATSGNSGQIVVRLGRAGYVAKGVSVAIVGILFLWAAWTYDPAKAGGLDAALSTLLDQPFGRWLMSLVALGLAAFGAYCFGWARYPKE